MKKLILFITFFSLTFAKSSIWDEGRILNIEGYDKASSFHLGKYFTLLQSEYFASMFLIGVIGIICVFALHYMIIGPKVFSHEGEKIYVFGVFSRIIHFLAAVSFILLVPTGLIMVFGSSFGGGVFVRTCKYIHDFGTVVFCIAVVPMFLIWFLDMFPKAYDLKWILIGGGYLSKEIKPVPSGKYNFGQKAWFWTATLGGFVMIATGAMMFFLDVENDFLRNLTKLSQIDILRASAIIHNILGVAVVVFFITHVYMVAFAIKGAMSSMIDGYKHEDEVKNLHSMWYKKLQEKKRA